MFQILKLLWKHKKLTALILVASTLKSVTYRQLPDLKQYNQKKYVEEAESPTDLSAAGWKRALSRTKTALKDKDIATSAAGLAYYATLTFFPTIIGLASFYILFSSPEHLLSTLDDLRVVFPAAIADLLRDQLAPLASTKPAHIGAAALVSVLALLWTTSGGVQNLVKATNKAYEVEETRNFVKLRLTSLGISILMLIIASVVVFLLILQGDALRSWGMPPVLATIFPIIRWPLLIALISVLLSSIYKYAPNRSQPQWQWVSWGATAATILWLVASALFFIYVQNFANFNKSYGTFAGIIILMTWFNYSSLIILVGAQVNKNLRKQPLAIRPMNEIRFTNEHNIQGIGNVIGVLERPRLWVPASDYPDYYYWLHKVENELGSQVKRAMLAYSGGDPVGVVLYQRHKKQPDAVEIKNISVSPEVRHRYFGSFLLRNVEMEALGSDFPACSKLIVDTKVGNEGMIGFLLRNKYIPNGVADLYGLGAGDDILFSKNPAQLNKT